MKLNLKTNRQTNKQPKTKQCISLTLPSESNTTSYEYKQTKDGTAFRYLTSVLSESIAACYLTRTS